MASANNSGYHDSAETACKMLNPLLIQPPSMLDLPLPPDSDQHLSLVHISWFAHQLERNRYVALLHSTLIYHNWEKIWPWVSCFLELTRRKEYQTSKELDDIVSVVAHFFHMLVTTRELAERLSKPDSSPFIAFLYTRTNSALNPVLSEAWIWAHYHGSRRAFSAVCRAAVATLDLLNRLWPLPGYPLFSEMNNFYPRLEFLAGKEGRNTLCEVLLGRVRNEVYPLRSSLGRKRLIDTDILYAMLDTVEQATMEIPLFQGILVCNSYPRLITNILSLLCMSPPKRFTSSPESIGESYEIYTRLCCILRCIKYLKSRFTGDGPHYILLSLRCRHPTHGVLVNLVKAIQLAREAQKAHPGMSEKMRRLCSAICVESCGVLRMISSACTTYRAICGLVRKSILVIEKAELERDVLEVMSIDSQFNKIWTNFRSISENVEVLKSRKQLYQRTLMRICSNDECTSQKPLTCQPRECSGCRIMIYCSRTCQKAHWKSGHKAVCLDARSRLAVGRSTPISDLEIGYIRNLIYGEIHRRSELARQAVSKQGLLCNTGKPLVYFTCVDYSISSLPSRVSEECQVLSGPLLKRLGLPRMVTQAMDRIIRENDFRVIIGVGMSTEDWGQLRVMVKGVPFEPGMETGDFDYEVVLCENGKYHCRSPILSREKR